jgi:hypothetical protein
VQPQGESVTEIDKPVFNEETRTLQCLRPDGRGQLSPGETVASCEVFCLERATGVDTTETMVSDVTPYDQTQIKYRLKGGVAGKVYNLFFHFVSSHGQKLSDQIVLRVN